MCAARTASHFLPGDATYLGMQFSNSACVHRLFHYGVTFSRARDISNIFAWGKYDDCQSQPRCDGVQLAGVTDGGRRKLNGVTDGAPEKGRRATLLPIQNVATFNLSDRTNQNT